VASARRLVIAGPVGDPPPPAGWVPACKLALGLDDADAKRLWVKLPVTVTLPPLDDTQVAETIRRLQKAGATVSAAPHPFKAERCSVHRRASADEVCPRCTERRACALCLATTEPPLCPSCSGRKRFFTRFRNVRVAILLGVLLTVAFVTWNDNRRATSWTRPLTVAIVPVDATGDPDVARWVAGLDDARFAAVGEFLQREAARYGVTLSPVLAVALADPIADVPPQEPDDLTSRVQIAAWSLKLRWWSWRQSRTHAFPESTVKIYVVYESDKGQVPEESLGLKQGRIGIVRTLAGQEESGWTNITIAHELLHTLGATDKYKPNGMPVHPDGYAEPDRIPLVPQVFAEIMAGQIALTKDNTFMQARSLDKCRVGGKTALEIGWKR
jgi:hypothetical protein